jgi:hypothetical protein
MIDIISAEDGLDLGVSDSIVPKAGNVLSVQLGTLEYAPDFGVDLRYFLTSDLQYQNESFKSYLIQRLTESQVNVSSVLESFETLFENLTFYVGDNNKTTGGLIR